MNSAYESGETNNTARDQTVFAVCITETVVMHNCSLNGERFRPAFAERDNKPTIIDLRGNSTNWFKNQLYLSTRLSRLRAQRRYDMKRGGTT